MSYSLAYCVLLYFLKAVKYMCTAQWEFCHIYVVVGFHSNKQPQFFFYFVAVQLTLLHFLLSLRTWVTSIFWVFQLSSEALFQNPKTLSLSIQQTANLFVEEREKGFFGKGRRNRSFPCSHGQQKTGCYTNSYYLDKATNRRCQD